MPAGRPKKVDDNFIPEYIRDRHGVQYKTLDLLSRCGIDRQSHKIGAVKRITHQLTKEEMIFIANAAPKQIALKYPSYSYNQILTLRKSVIAKLTLENLQKEP